MQNNLLLAVEPVTTPKTNTNTKPAPNSNTGTGIGTVTPGLGGTANTSVGIPEITNPFKTDSATGLASKAITVIFSFIVVAAVVVIIISGFRMVTGGGNPDQLKKAKTGITWALIGLVVAFMAFAIVSLVQQLL